MTLICWIAAMKLRVRPGIGGLPGLTLVLFSLAGGAGTAKAGFLTYTDLASWQAATSSPITLEDFSDEGLFYLGTPNTQSFSGVAFNGFTVAGNSNGDFLGIAPQATSLYSGQVVSAGSGLHLESSRSRLPFAAPDGSPTLGDGGIGPTFTLTFASPVSAFSFDWGDSESRGSYQVTINGTSFSDPPFSTVSTIDPFRGFFGVVATGGETFTTVTFSQATGTLFSGRFGIDNIRFEQASADEPNAVPAPPSLVLLSIGAGCWSLARLRRRQKTS